MRSYESVPNAEDYKGTAVLGGIIFRPSRHSAAAIKLHQVPRSDRDVSDVAQLSEHVELLISPLAYRLSSVMHN